MDDTGLSPALDAHLMWPSYFGSWATEAVTVPIKYPLSRPRAESVPSPFTFLFRNNSADSFTSTTKASSRPVFAVLSSSASTSFTIEEKPYVLSSPQSRRQRVKALFRRRAFSLKSDLSLHHHHYEAGSAIPQHRSFYLSASSSLVNPAIYGETFTPAINWVPELNDLKEIWSQRHWPLNSVPRDQPLISANTLFTSSFFFDHTSGSSPIQKTGSDTMSISRQSSLFLDPAAASRQQFISDSKARTQKLATDEEAFIRERMRVKGTAHLFPKYRFIDFIGKGAYGRVYQACDLNVNPPREVAIKLINVDDVDYSANAMAKDESVNDIRKEIQVLMQLKEHKAKNVNLIHDVLEVDGQLWLICEYCPGGSLRTLLRASNYRCEEKYIKVIVRELAIGLQAIHEANIIHRDLKAANVMIHEEGGLQIIDFGVAGIVESKLDKRGTIIGTPYWMPPEQHKASRTNDLQYGFEVDVWSYIVTIYEIATGAPPHSKLPTNRLASALRTRPPRLSEDQFSKELCDFVEFVAQPEPTNRPSVAEILDHPYVRDSQLTYPNTLLKDLVDRFMKWTFTGGQRVSLFMPHGAPASSDFVSNRTDNVEFIFSTSRDMAAEFDPTYDPFSNSPPNSSALPFLQVSSPSGEILSGEFDNLSCEPPDDYTSRPATSVPALPLVTGDRDPGEDRRIARGGHALESIFDQSQKPYEYGIRSGDMSLDKPILSRAKSDLPLRNSEAISSSLARKEVDMADSSSSKSDVELADADTIKQKRKQQAKDKRETLNMGWQPDWSNLEANMSADTDLAPSMPTVPLIRPKLVHAETAPDKISQARASTATMNLDDLLGDDEWQLSSALGRTPAVSVTHEDDKYDTDPMQQSLDFNDSGFPSSYASSVADTSASASEEEPYPTPFATMPALHQDIAPPLPAAMYDHAPSGLVESELARLLLGFQSELAALALEFPTEDDIDKSFADRDSNEDEINDEIEGLIDE